MKFLQPLSEDFLYWSPEAIGTCLLVCGIGDNGFAEYRRSLSCVADEQKCMEVCDENPA
jgi:hypothetical protein